MTKQEIVAEAYVRLGGNAMAVSRETNIPRSTVRDIVDKLGLKDKPITGGKVKAMRASVEDLPASGKHVYLLTSAQNNTRIHDKFWRNLRAFADYLDARIMVGTYSYNKQAYGTSSVKHGSEHKDRSTDLWMDPSIKHDYIADDHVELAPGLIWCGEMNIMPTAARPLSGLESYTGRKSSIFPHAKIAMESIASGKHEPTKFCYTTGTITQRNYVQKKAGLKAEHHHCYGALIVEVDSTGQWFVRQLNATDDGTFYDFDLRVKDGKVTGGHRVEGINLGDTHCDMMDLDVLDLLTKEEGMIRELQPRHLLVNDLLNFGPRNHHDRNNPHKRFDKFVRNEDQLSDDVEAEMHSCKLMLDDLQEAGGEDCQIVVVDSNHDNAFERWLREADYRTDPRNAVYFLRAQLEKYRSIRDQERHHHMVEWALRDQGCSDKVRFLRADESFVLCGKIECGMHGHLGPNGTRGNPLALSKSGRKANTGHTHSAGIYDGLYVAGTSSLLDLGYNLGPSSWSHSHVITYPNGKRCIVTMWNGKWRA